jgi:hypothetical protein
LKQPVVYDTTAEAIGTIISHDHGEYGGGYRKLR